MTGGTCTSLDHVYPSTIPGTPCYCGRHTWAGAKRRPAGPLTAGARVRIGGVERTVIEKLRGEDCYRVNEPVSGRALFERVELEAL